MCLKIHKGCRGRLRLPGPDCPAGCRPRHNNRPDADGFSNCQQRLSCKEAAIRLSARSNSRSRQQPMPTSAPPKPPHVDCVLEEQSKSRKMFSRNCFGISAAAELQLERPQPRCLENVMSDDISGVAGIAVVLMVQLFDRKHSCLGVLGFGPRSQLQEGVSDVNSSPRDWITRRASNSGFSHPNHEMEIDRSANQCPTKSCPA